MSAKDHTGRETAPRGVGLPGRTLKTIRTEGAPGVPTQAPVLITPEEPRVLIVEGGQSVDLEKEMATHSSVLAWRIPGTGEPGGLSSLGSHRVGHDRSDLAAAAAIRRFPFRYWGNLFCAY